MAKKPSQPALYELISNRAPKREFQRDSSAGHDADDDDAINYLAWLRPGRTIRLPVGYLFAAAAVVIGLVFVSYVIGYGRGETSEQAAQSRELAEALREDTLARQVQDPLQSSRGSGQQSPQRSSSTVSTENSSGKTTSRNPDTREPDTKETAPSGSPQQARLGPITSDPRQRGVNYFILATYTRANAIKLAKFCRRRGLNAYVVRYNDSSNRQVIVTPGYSSGQRSSEPIKVLERMIRTIGREWDNAGWHDDLGSAYPDLYQGE